MALSRRDTVMVLTGTTEHLTIVMNDPVFSPEHSWDAILCVNFTSIVPGTPFDDACTADAGCHPFLRHPSFALYLLATVFRAETLQRRLDCGEVRSHERVSEELFERVRAGLFKSQFANGKIKRFVKNCAPALLQPVP